MKHKKIGLVCLSVTSICLCVTSINISFVCIEKNVKPKKKLKKKKEYSFQTQLAQCEDFAFRFISVFRGKLSAAIYKGQSFPGSSLFHSIPRGRKREDSGNKVAHFVAGCCLTFSSIRKKSSSFTVLV